MFFERSRFFRDNDMSALVLILRKEQYCMFVLYIRMFVGDRLNIIVASVNIPSKCSYYIGQMLNWNACNWYYCMVDHGYWKYSSGLHVIKRSPVCCCSFFLPASPCWLEFKFKLHDWACSKFAIFLFHSTFQYILFAYNLIIGRCKTASQNQLERVRNGIKIGCMAILSGPWF